ncbi:MAG: acetyl-CoA carboxylase biotin carboxyl carrier protein subunit [Armatimonadota bacterium]
MDLKRVEELIELMRQSGVMQLSLELPDFKVSITRGPEGAEVVRSESQSDALPAANPGEQTGIAPVAAEERVVSVVAPVVGVFHNGGMLDPREMVREGDRVREGQLLAAIEAMKVPNELRAPVSGLVTQLMVADGSAVEYGQTLFLIAPDDRGGAGDADPLIGLA